MNEDSLYIHSFLMHNDIPFLRYFHPACRTLKEWQGTVKKLNARCTAVFTTFACCEEQGRFILKLSASASEQAFPPQEREQAVLESLRCRAENFCTLSPLSLVFDQAHRCCLSIEQSLRTEQRLCFPCADATESVVLNTSDFLGRFIPAAGIALVD